MPRAFALLAALLLGVPFPGDSAKKAAPPPPPPATIPELVARIQEVLDSTHTPGVGLAIVRRDSVIFAGGVGKSRVSPARAATDSTLFRIGSTSKAFVALTELALQQEGKLSLNDPVRKYLPGFYYGNPWEATDTIRIVNLLEHTSGFDDNSLKSYASNDPTPLTLVQGLALDSGTRVARWRPGTRFSYCNTGPAIVARVIEVIEGKPFEQVVQERWFTPIGMATATYFRPDTTRFDAVTLYHPDGVTPYTYWNVFIRPAGAINASARDMAAYVRFLLARGTVNGKKLLTRESIDRMERSESWIGARAGLTVGYGLNMYRTADTLGFVWMGHNGGVEGGITDMSYLPEQGVGYAYEINSGDPDAVRQITALVRGFVTRGLAPLTPPATGHVPPSVQKEFTGWYRDVAPRQEHLYFLERLQTMTKLTVSDSSLRLAPIVGAPITFVAVDSTHFRRPGQAIASLALVRDVANGRPQGIEAFGSGLGGSSAKVSGGSVALELTLTCAWLLGLLLAVLAAIFGAIRWVLRLLMRRPRPTPAARPLWWLALGATVWVLVNVALLGSALNDLSVGRLSGMSVSLYCSGVLFGLVSLAGAVAVFLPRRAGTPWDKFSVFTVKAVLVLNAVAAAYLVYWGYIGWRTWA